MLRIGTPKNRDRFVCINDDELSFILQERGFFPLYKDEKGLYFVDSCDLMSTILDYVQGFIESERRENDN